MVNPILFDIPNSLESERLIIRAPRLDDGPKVNKAVCESLEQLKPWMIWAQTAPSLEQSITQIRKSHINFLSRDDLQLLLFCKETNQLVGSSGLHRIDWDVKKFEIGYWVSSSFAKKGYITEAVNAITIFAIEQLQANRIEIRCDELNEQSAKIAERCGYTLEGILRNDSLSADGKLRNTKVFSKVRGKEF